MRGSRLAEPCKNLFGCREAIFDFSFKGSVGEKGFDDFDNFQQSFENGQFVKKAFMPDSIEGFLYVNKYQGGCTSLL